jgi:N-ethylmaleimide reductase
MVNWADKIKIGSTLIKNRVCMASLTRQRCNPLDGVPNQLLVDHYVQRSGAGMILT